jgi:hypothetical protein
MVSKRNVSLKENYVLIRSYAGSSNRDLKRNRARTIDDAIDNLVRTVPGGEFLQNCKVYKVSIFKKTRYAVDGDVYGLDKAADIKGFKIGTKVMWKSNFDKFTGVILDLKNDKEATVRDSGGEIRIVKYSDMTKIE